MSSHFKIRITKIELLIFFNCFLVIFGFSQPADLQSEIDISNMLPNNSVRDIQVDRHHRVWLATEGGLTILNPNTPFLKKIISDNTDASVLSICFSGSMVLIGTETSGIRVYDLEREIKIVGNGIDSIRYVRRIRNFHDTFFVASNEGAFRLILANNFMQSKRIFTGFLNGGFITDFYTSQGSIYAHSFSASPRNLIYRYSNDSLIQATYPAFLPQKRNLSFLTSFSNDSMLAFGGDGFYSLGRKEGWNGFQYLENKNESKNHAVWDFELVGNRLFMAVGQPFRMKMGALYEVGSIGKQQILPDFYCQSLHYDMHHQSMWMGTYGRGAFLWPYLSNAIKLPIGLKRVNALAIAGKNRIISYDDEHILFTDISKGKSELFYDKGEGSVEGDVYEVQQWGDTTAVLFSTRFKMYDKTEKVVFEYQFDPHLYSHMYLSGEYVFLFTIYDRGILKFNLTTKKSESVKGMSQDTKGINFSGSHFYFAEGKGFFMLDSVVRPYSPLISKSEDFTIMGDTLLTMNAGFLRSFKIDKYRHRMIFLKELPISSLLNGTAVTWVKFEGGKLLLGNYKGFFELDRKTLMPLWFRYIGNFSHLNKPLYLQEHFVYTLRDHITRIPLTGPDTLDVGDNLTVSVNDAKRLEVNQALTIKINSNDYFLQRYGLKQLVLTDRIGNVSNFFTLDSVIYIPNGLPKGKYNLELLVNNKSSFKQTLSISYPLLQDPFFYGVITLVLISIIVIYFRTQATRRDRERVMLENRLQILKKNLDPHFVFNSLNLTYMLLLQEKTKEATDSILQFSDLHRYYLEIIDKQTVPLSDELEFIKKYLSLEQKRKTIGADFDYEINLSGNQVTEIMIPPMLLHPLVENAVKYCDVDRMILPKPFIHIEAKSDFKKLVIVIQNSIGPLTQEKHIGFQKGLAMVEEAVGILNKKRKGWVVFSRKILYEKNVQVYSCSLNFMHSSEYNK